LRESINFNRGWKFQLGDVTNASAARFDDSKWDDANLPHSFSMPYFAADRFYVGYGWYRKYFDAPKASVGRRIQLEFDGVFQVAELFVNGKRIGEHKGGYTGFTFDITDAVKTGANVVAVRVNNNWDARLAPRAGEHTFSGGIYRDVRMVVTDPVHVTWYGTSVTTPQVSKGSGTVNVKTEIVNESPRSKSVSVETSVVDAKGKTVAEAKSKQSIAAGATNVFDQTSGAIANPALWSPEHPNLYSVKTVVLDGSTPVDDYTSPFGLRAPTCIKTTPAGATRWPTADFSVMCNWSNPPEWTSSAARITRMPRRLRMLVTKSEFCSGRKIVSGARLVFAAHGLRAPIRPIQLTNLNFRRASKRVCAT
jgi:beta-galactosidase/beta-glucuronidase